MPKRQCEMEFEMDWEGLWLSHRNRDDEEFDEAFLIMKSRTQHDLNKENIDILSQKRFDVLDLFLQDCMHHMTVMNKNNFITHYQVLFASTESALHWTT